MAQESTGREARDADAEPESVRPADLRPREVPADAAVQAERGELPVDRRERTRAKSLAAVLPAPRQVALLRASKHADRRRHIALPRGVGLEPGQVAQDLLLA